MSLFLTFIARTSVDVITVNIVYSTVFTLTPFLGDITRFSEMGHRFKNLSASRGHSFCSNSNRLLGSRSCFSGLVVGRSEPVLFIFNRKNELYE